MRSKFPHYVNYTPEQFKELWEKATIVLDTNVLLELLRLSEKSREETFKLLENLKDRLWIPYQVGLEFNRNKDEVCGDNVKLFEEAKGKLKINALRFSVADVGVSAAKHLLDCERIDEIIKTHNKKIEEHNNSIDNEIKLQVDAFEDKYDSDGVVNKIIDLFEGKIGHPPSSQSELDSIYRDGEIRFKNNIPPGYKDSNKSNTIYSDRGLYYRSEYGDLVLWKQIISHAEKQKLKHVIFITNDQKEDWWQKSHGKKEGPRKELISEIVAIGDVELFHMYTLENFLRFSKDQGGVELSDSSLKEIGDLSEKHVQELNIEKHIQNLKINDFNRKLYFSSKEYNKKLSLPGYVVEQRIIGWYLSKYGRAILNKGIDGFFDFIIKNNNEQIFVEIIYCIGQSYKTIAKKIFDIVSVAIKIMQNQLDYNFIDSKNDKIHIAIAFSDFDEPYGLDALLDYFIDGNVFDNALINDYTVEILLLNIENDGSGIHHLVTLPLN